MNPITIQRNIFTNNSNKTIISKSFDSHNIINIPPSNSTSSSSSYNSDDDISSLNINENILSPDENIIISRNESYNSTLNYFELQDKIRRDAINKYIDTHTKNLTFYEKKELRDLYDVNDLYYNGTNDINVKIRGIYNSISDRYNFTDNDYNYKLKENDHLNYRYETRKIIGKGAFGVVVLCYDHKKTHKQPTNYNDRNNFVAVKIIKNKYTYNEIIKTEINILEHIKKLKSNITNSHLKDIIITYHETINFRKHTMLIFDCYGQNLYKALKSNKFEGYSISNCRSITYDICLGLQFLHNNKIIHRDLKPENLVLRTGRVIIIDFGLSTIYNNQSQDLNFYMQSRYYRAPELIFKINKSFPMDIWSVGCIMYEIYDGLALFPGRSEKDMISYFISVLGYPDISYLKNYNPINYFKPPSYVINSMNVVLGNNDILTLYEKTAGFKYGPQKVKKRPCDSNSVFNNYKNFCHKCLTWDFNERPDINKLLEHDLFNYSCNKTKKRHHSI